MLLVIREDQKNIWFKSADDNYVELHQFVQYVLDSCSDPAGYTIVGNRFKMNLMKYVELTGMHKRSFEERIKHILTGSIPQSVTQHAIIMMDFRRAKENEL